jgi:hypothetical protein
VSRLVALGHPDAIDYPLGRLWDEVSLADERENQKFVTLAVIIQKATSTTGMTASKEAYKLFNEFIQELSGD